MTAGRLLIGLEAAVAVVSIAAAQGLRLSLLAAVAAVATTTTRARHAGFAGAALLAVVGLLAIMVIGSPTPQPPVDRCSPARIARQEPWSRHVCGPADRDTRRALRHANGHPVGSR